MIEVHCHICSRTIQLDDAWAGRQGKCPGCGTVLTVPAAGSPSFPAVPTEPTPAPPPIPTVAPLQTAYAAPSSTTRSPLVPPPGAPARRGWWERRSHAQLVGMLAAFVVVVAVVVTATAIAPITKMALRENRPAAEEAQQWVEATDAAAKSLVRNAMAAIESAYVDLRDFTPGAAMADALAFFVPSIWFIPGNDPGAATSPDWQAQAWADAVNYFGSATTYAVGTISESGTTFGVVVDKSAGGGSTFYVDGDIADW